MLYVFQLVKRVSSIIVFLLITVTMATAQNVDRLQESIVPLHYVLDLTIMPKKDIFTGKAVIEVNLGIATNVIKLHGKGLTVNSASVLASDGSTVAATYQENTDNGQAILELSKTVGPGIVKLRLIYSGKISTSEVGLYKSQHGQQTYVYTQLQPTRARRVFPSFDEPRFKTPFEISIEHRTEQIAVSNGPAKTSLKTKEGFVRTQFETTKPLPTYLVAMAVGEFDVVEWEALPPTSVRDRAVPLRGIAPKGDGKKLTYALENTRAIFEILENWFQIPYPYAKLDLVAAHSFRSAGMENAGAVFYRANKLLLPDPPSVYATRGFASLHAHELAHSWFGNLVTPVWWDEIWLNESFATWMANKALNIWKPSQYTSHRAIESASRAMWNDRLAGARAVRRPVLTNGDIANAFDSTSYSKGGGVLTMIERFMGEELFQKAIQSHLRAHLHGVASTDELLNEFSSGVGQPELAKAARSFLDEPGVPHVSAKLICTPDSSISVRIKQSRFLPLGSKGNSDKRWILPICLAFGKSDGTRAEQCQLLSRAAVTTVPLKTKQCPVWLLPNAGGAAYMVFDLDSVAWDKLVANFDKLTTGEQISLAASIRAAYLSGRIDTARLLQFIQLLGNSPNWDVSRTAIQMVRTLKFGVVPKQLRPQVEKAARQAFAKARSLFDLDPKSFGTANADPVKAKQRADLFWFLALDAGDTELRGLLANAGRKYAGYDSFWGMNYKQLHPDLVWVGLIAAMDETGLPYAKHLIKLLGKGFDRPLHRSLLAALSHSTDPAVIQLVRGHMLKSDTPSADVRFLLRRQTRRSDNAEGSLNWLTKNYDKLLEILPASQHPWLSWRTAASCNLEAHNRIKAFFEPRIAKLTGARRALRNVLENVSLCTALREAQRSGAISAFSN